MALLSSASIAGNVLISLARLDSFSVFIGASSACSCGYSAKELAKRLRSLGRAERSATRPKIRSKSPIFFKCSLKSAKISFCCSASTASRRCSSACLFRSGLFSHRRRFRPPIAVLVVLKTSSRVFSSVPRVLVSISKLIRVAASSCTLCSGCSMQSA